MRVEGRYLVHNPHAQPLREVHVAMQDDKTLSRMNQLVALLGQRERDILNLRFGLQGGKPQTLEEVSRAIGRTRERVRQIQNQALDKLKVLLNEEKTLEDFAREQAEAQDED